MSDAGHASAESAIALERRPDAIERIDGALVQHGPFSDRVYLLEQGPTAESDIAVMGRLARNHRYSKLFAKVSGDRASCFVRAGFVAEARIPAGAGELDLVFVSRFLSAQRAVERNPVRVREILDTALKAAPHGATAARTLPPDTCRPRTAEPADASDLAQLYAGAFASYPFPIDDPQFLRTSMDAGVRYLLVRDPGSGQVIAAASAERLDPWPTCEMTDFATLPARQGLGIAGALLRELEHEAERAGMRMAFTIARSTSPGMNVVFARHGYAYAGTLVNNTNIAGRIESMNVWYRALG